MIKCLKRLCICFLCTILLLNSVLCVNVYAEETELNEEQTVETLKEDNPEENVDIDNEEEEIIDIDNEGEENIVVEDVIEENNEEIITEETDIEEEPIVKEEPSMELTSLTRDTFVNSVEQGDCGDYVTYIYYEDDSLQIYATEPNAEMDTYSDGECFFSNKFPNLKKVIINDGVASIGQLAFEHCENLESVTIADSVTYIGAQAFSYCESLKSITIPNSVTSIYMGAFEYSGLTSIVLPNSITKIEDFTFIQSELTSITIPSSVTSIGEWVFEDTNLTSITIPNSVTEIGKCAFCDCPLTTIKIPASVTSIGDCAFNNKYNIKNAITSITVDPSNPKYSSGSRNDQLIDKTTHTLLLGCSKTIIDNSVTSIGDYAFSMCDKLTSISIPSTVTSIGEDAFHYCDALKSITIPDSVTSIGEYAFEECYGLISVNLSNSLDTINKGVFDWCYHLSTISIPDSVQTIKDYAFCGCDALTSIYIPSSVESISDEAFSECSSVESIIVDPSNTVYDSREDCNAIIETNTNKLVRGSNTTIIPNTVTSLGKNCFESCNFGFMEIPSSVTLIDENAFKGGYDSRGIDVSKELHIFIPKTNPEQTIKAYAFGKDTKIYTDASQKPAAWEDLWNRDKYNEDYLAPVEYDFSVESFRAMAGLKQVPYDLYIYQNSNEDIIIETYDDDYLTEIKDSIISLFGGRMVTGSYYPYRPLITSVTRLVPEGEDHISADDLDDYYDDYYRDIIVDHNKITLDLSKHMVKIPSEVIYLEDGQPRYSGSNLYAVELLAPSYHAAYFKLKIRGLFKVCYYDDDDQNTLLHTDYAKEGTSPAIWNSGVKTGYTFLGWFRGDYDGAAKITSIRGIQSNYDLYGRWAPNKYNIAFNANGGTGVTPSVSNVEYDADVTLSTNGFSRVGYDFAGWNTDKYGNGTSYTDGQEVSNLANKASTVTLYAMWQPHSYTISYEKGEGGEGDDMPSSNCTYDVAFSLPSNLYYKKGYAFDGWTYVNASGQTVTVANGASVKNLTSVDGGSVTLTAKWKVVDYYTIKYNLNGGTQQKGITIPTKYTYTEGSVEVLTLPIPTRTGYNFMGWCKDKECSVVVGGSYTAGTPQTIPLTSYENFNLYADWEPIHYTIHFDKNNTNATGEMNDISAEYGTSIPLPELAFVREGINFSKWQDTATNKTYANKATVINLTSVDGSTVILKAVWTYPKTSIFSVKYNLNGGTNQKANITSYNIDTPEFTLLEPTRKGYIFQGWFDSYTKATKTTSESWGNQITSVNGDDRKAYTLYAKWQPITYTVSFNKNADEATGSMDQQTFTYDVQAKVNVNGFSRPGYIFNGWTYTNESNKQATVKDNAAIKNISSTNRDVEFKAQWKVVSYYTIKYNLNSGTQQKGITIPTKYTYDGESQEVLTLPIPTRTGYNFMGWFKDKECNVLLGGSYTAGTPQTIPLTSYENFNLYAKWEPIHYSIVFVSANTQSEGSMESITNIAYGESVTLPANAFTVTGINFSKWQDTTTSKTYSNKAKVSNLTTVDNSTVTLRALWTYPKASVFSIKYNLNGGTNPKGNITSYNVDTPEFTLLEPTKKGYTFISWNASYTKASKNTPEQWGPAITSVKGENPINHTLFAKWKANSYTVKYDSNGGSGSMSDSTCTYDVSYKLPAYEFYNPGYVFAGWTYTNTSGKTASVSNLGSIKNLRTEEGDEVTLYAKWKAVANYTIKYNLNGGKQQTGVVIPTKFNSNQNSNEITFPTPSRVGYDFGGWYKDKGFTTPLQDSATYDNLVLYAKWNAHTYTIKFDPNEGSGTMNDVPCTYDVSIKLPAYQFTRQGYVFAGWSYTNTAGKTASVSNLASVKNLRVDNNDEVTLYAKWKAVANYTIKYNLNGGKQQTGVVIPTKFNSNQSSDEIYSLLPQPTKTGYTFAGWYKDKDLTVPLENSATYDNLVLYAKWEAEN